MLFYIFSFKDGGAALLPQFSQQLKGRLPLRENSLFFELGDFFDGLASSKLMYEKKHSKAPFWLKK